MIFSKFQLISKCVRWHVATCRDIAGLFSFYFLKQRSVATWPFDESDRVDIFS